MIGETHQHEASVVVNGANSLLFYPTFPVEIQYVGYIMTTASDAVFILTVSHEEADGTALDPTGAAEGGTITSVAATYALNKGSYRAISSSVTGRRIKVFPGERLEVLSDAGGSTGVARVFVQYRPLPMVDSESERANDATIPGAVTLTGYLDAMTLVTA